MWSVGGSYLESRASFGNSVIKSESKLKFP